MGGRLFGRMDDGMAGHGRSEGRDGGEGLRRGMGLPWAVLFHGVSGIGVVLRMN